jgi:hypothetical protein
MLTAKHFYKEYPVDGEIDLKKEKEKEDFHIMAMTSCYNSLKTVTTVKNNNYFIKGDLYVQGFANDGQLGAGFLPDNILY